MNLLKKNKSFFIIFSIMIISIISIYQYISLAPKKIVAITPKYTGNANEFN